MESSGPKRTGDCGISSVRDRIAAFEKTKNDRAAAPTAVPPPQKPKTTTETKIVTLEDEYGFEYEAPVTITTTTTSSSNSSKTGSTVNKEKNPLNNGGRQFNASTNRKKSFNYPRNVVNTKDDEEGTEESDDYGVAFDIPVYVDANITKSSAKSTTIRKMYKYNDEEDDDYDGCEEEDDDVVVLRPVPIDDDLYSQYTFDNLSGIVTQATAFDTANDNKSIATRGSTYIHHHDHYGIRNSHHSRRSVLHRHNQQQGRQEGDNPTTIETTPVKNDCDDSNVDVDCTGSGENPTASKMVRAVTLKETVSSRSSAVSTIEDTGNTSSFSSKIKIFERMNSSFSFGFNNNNNNNNKDDKDDKDDSNKEKTDETTADFPDKSQDADIEKQQVGLCDKSSSSSSNGTEKEFSDIDLENDVQNVVMGTISGQKVGTSTTITIKASKKQRGKKSTSSSSPPSWFRRFSCSMDNRNFCALVTFFVLIIVIGTLVAVVTHYREKESSISSSSGSAHSGTAPAGSPSTGPAKGTLAPTYPGDTYAPTISASPTNVPTASPTTAMPTINYIDSMMEFFQDYQIMFDKGPNDPAYMALEWLNMEANLIDKGINLNGDLVQRFAVLVLEYSLNRTQAVSDEDVDGGAETSEGIDRSVAQMNVHECEWPGIICGSKNVTSTTNPNSTETVDNIVKEIHFGSSGLVGTIPRQINLLSDLEYLDVSNNDLHGSLPETLYDLSSLRKIFAYKNQLTGTLSDRVGGKLSSLTHFHLSHNNLTGSIPGAWASSGEIARPLQYFNVYSNALTGIIPSSLRFSSVWYFDVGRNNLEGPLPDDVGSQFVELRHLLLDHNSFNGTLPESYINVGNGRLESFHIDHNQLTGQVPGNHDQRDKLVEFTLHNNSFTKLGKNTCKLSVFNGGEMVEFKADEDICDCSPFCGQR